MATNYTPQVGDIVKFEGPITRVSLSGESVLVNDQWFGPEELELVERPEKTVTITLTESGLAALWSKSLAHLPDDDFDAIAAAVYPENGFNK